MDFLLTVAHGLALIPDWLTNHKEIVGLALASGVSISFVLQPLKKWLGLQKKVTIEILHYALALVPVAVHYIQGSHSTNPVIIFLQAFVLVGNNQFIYPLVTKPLWSLFRDAKAEATVQKIQTETEQFLG